MKTELSISKLRKLGHRNYAIVSIGKRDFGTNLSRIFTDNIKTYISKTSYNPEEIIVIDEEGRVIDFRSSPTLREETATAGVIELMINEFGNTYNIIETDAGNEAFSLITNRLESPEELEAEFVKQGYIAPFQRTGSEEEINEKNALIVLNDVYGKDPKSTDVYYPLNCILKAMVKFASLPYREDKEGVNTAIEFCKWLCAHRIEGYAPGYAIIDNIRTEGRSAESLYKQFLSSPPETGKKEEEK